MLAPRIPPELAPAAMNANTRLPCSRSKRSAMKLQNTDTTNRLKTLTHTKNTRAADASSAAAVNTAQKPSSCATNSRYTQGRKTERGKRPDIQP
jgi:hypothetical protein